MKRLRGEGIARARLLEYSEDVIAECYRAFGSELKLVVSVPDDEVHAFGSDDAKPKQFAATVGPWIRRGVVDTVLVGVTPPSGVGADVGWLNALANATRNVARACKDANAEVAVSTSFSLSVLRSSYPPSASLFAAPAPLQPILAHLLETNAPFVIELDHYLAWRQSYYDISLDYALFGLDYPDDGNVDSPEFNDAGGYGYFNLFDAMVDAVRWALYREGFSLDVVVGSVGWPSGWYRPTSSGSSSSSLTTTTTTTTLGHRRRRQQRRAAAAQNLAVYDERPPPAAGVAYAAKFNSRLAKHLNCTRSAVPLANSAGCAPLVAYILEADDSFEESSQLAAAEDKRPTSEPTRDDASAQTRRSAVTTTHQQSSPHLMWGICDGRTGRLKYSIRTGQVFAPVDVLRKDTPSRGGHTLWPLLLAFLCAGLFVVTLLRKQQHRRPKAASSSSLNGLEATTTSASSSTSSSAGPPKNGVSSASSAAKDDTGAATTLTVAAESNGDRSRWLPSLFFAAKKSSAKKPLVTRHTADNVATIIRSTRFTAEENLRDERSRRMRDRGYGSRGFFSRSYYLHRIAEGPSPLPSDDEDALLGVRSGSAKKLVDDATKKLLASSGAAAEDKEASEG